MMLAAVSCGSTNSDPDMEIIITIGQARKSKDAELALEKLR
jgi:hypothetical protein